MSERLYDVVMTYDPKAGVHTAHCVDPYEVALGPTESAAREALCIALAHRQGHAPSDARLRVHPEGTELIRVDGPWLIRVRRHRGAEWPGRRGLPRTAVDFIRGSKVIATVHPTEEEIGLQLSSSWLDLGDPLHGEPPAAGPTPWVAFRLNLFRRDRPPGSSSTSG